MSSYYNLEEKKRKNRRKANKVCWGMVWMGISCVLCVLSLVIEAI